MSHAQQHALAADMLQKVFMLLEAQEIRRCALVCRDWRDAQNDPELWRHLSRRHGWQAPFHKNARKLRAFYLRQLASTHAFRRNEPFVREVQTCTPINWMFVPKHVDAFAWDIGSGSARRVEANANTAILVQQSPSTRVSLWSFDPDAPPSEPPKAVNAEVFNQFAGRSSVFSSIAIHGRYAVFALQQELRILDFANNECRRTNVSHLSTVSVIAVNSDLGVAATAGYDRVVRVWNLRTARQMLVHEVQPQHSRDEEKTTETDESNDENDEADGDDYARFSRRQVGIWCVDVCPRGRWIASAGNCVADYDVVLFPLFADASDYPSRSQSENERPVVRPIRLVGHTRTVMVAKFDESGLRLFTGGYDHTVREWCLDPESPRFAQCVRTYRGHTSCVYDLDISPSAVVTGSRDRRILVWDRHRHHQSAEEEESTSTSDSSEQVPSFVSENEEAEVVHDAALLYRSAAIHDTDIKAVRFLGQHCALSAGYDGKLVLWDWHSAARTAPDAVPDHRCLSNTESHERARGGNNNARAGHIVQQVRPPELAENSLGGRLWRAFGGK